MINCDKEKGYTKINGDGMTLLEELGNIVHTLHLNGMPEHLIVEAMAIGITSAEGEMVKENDSDFTFTPVDDDMFKRMFGDLFHE